MEYVSLFLNEPQSTTRKFVEMNVFTKTLFLLVPRNFFTRMGLVLFSLRQSRTDGGSVGVGIVSKHG